MAITLQLMTEQEFQSYLAHSTKHYAEEKIKAGTWLPEEAPELAEWTFKDLLPDGLETADHYLWTLTLDGKDNAGWLWLHADPDNPQQDAFIYDFGLHPPYRGKGYAKEAIARLEDKAKDLGVRKLSLHVFAHNETARKLYEKTGFLETDVIMSKKLS